MNKNLEKLIVHALPLEKLSYQNRIGFLRQNLLVAQNLPEEMVSIDPRTQDTIVYSLKRKNRPHDYVNILQEDTEKPCPVCLGETTEIWDTAALSTGYTFINANLFPIVYPFGAAQWPEAKASGDNALGTHLLQWHSTEHDKDLHNMPVKDIVVCLERLAAVEKYLLTQDSPACGEGIRGYIWIIKNYGRQSGSSLKHGHLQIIHSNIMPSAILRDQQLLQQEGKGFSTILQEKGGQNLLIKNYSHGQVLLFTPFCMKRMLDASICFQNAKKNYLHSLSQSEIHGLAEALKEAISSVLMLMPYLEKEPAYNLLFHIGEIGGLYIEIIPHTQEMGGYEHLGAYTCLLTPEESTALYRTKISELYCCQG